MNSNIIPAGPSEVINGGTISEDMVIVQAVTALVISTLVFNFPSTPTHVNKTVAFTLPAGQVLYRVASITFTGTAFVIFED